MKYENKVIVSLNEEDIRKIIASYFGVDAYDVEVSTYVNKYYGDSYVSATVDNVKQKDIDDISNFQW